MKNSLPFQKAPWFPLLSLLFLLGAVDPPALAQDEAVLLKDSVQVTAYTHVFDLRGAPPNWSPTIQFQLSDYPPDGSRLWAEASFPGKAKWRTGDCYRLVTLTNGWECLGKSDKEAVRFTGLVDFTIHISNELQGTNQVLFQGKAKVGKTPPKFKGQPNSFEYYVDEDWRIPIGYLSRGRTLNFEFAFKEHWLGVTAHLFHQGKAVAQGINCSGEPVRCEFFAGDDAIKELNPGEYEIKVLKDGRLRRTAAFTVAEDGSYDNGIAAANLLGSKKTIIPVQVSAE